MILFFILKYLIIKNKILLKNIKKNLLTAIKIKIKEE
jgi:hypothetical protein